MKPLASLIIDDPPLVPKYGNVIYEKLLKDMKRHNFFTEIAHIPHNYKRFNEKTVRLFAENPDRLGVCVHGYNHLNSEFGTTDYDYLLKMASSALWKMNQWSKHTGLSYDPVMVFPHCKFSSEAMKALRDTGYHAAFSSNLNSTDGPRDSCTLNDNEPCTDHYGFPLFFRHYPSQKDRIRQAISNNQPIIIVEHQWAFKSTELYDCIDWINRAADVQWTSLGEIVSRYSQFKPLPMQAVEFSEPVRLKIKAGTRRMVCNALDRFDCLRTFTEYLHKLRAA